jgi:hypothetical protein
MSLSFFMMRIEVNISKKYLSEKLVLSLILIEVRPQNESFQE